MTGTAPGGTDSPGQQPRAGWECKSLGWIEGEDITMLLTEDLGGETQMGPSDLCGEQRLGLDSAVSSVRGRGQDGPKVLIPGDTPPAVPVTPESHPACAGSCLILLPAISQSLSLLPAFPGC